MIDTYTLPDDVAEPEQPETHYRCNGCGAMDEELDGPCVLATVAHGVVAVDAEGQVLPPPPERDREQDLADDNLDAWSER